jgi:hypothetical protein
MEFKVLPNQLCRVETVTKIAGGCARTRTLVHLYGNSKCECSDCYKLQKCTCSATAMTRLNKTTTTLQSSNAKNTNIQGLRCCCSNTCDVCDKLNTSVYILEVQACVEFKFVIVFILINIIYAIHMAT